eukprot:835714-Pyramimonas_sp.AAC.1
MSGPRLARPAARHSQKHAPVVRPAYCPRSQTCEWNCNSLCARCEYCVSILRHPPTYRSPKPG